MITGEETDMDQYIYCLNIEKQSKNWVHLQIYDENRFHNEYKPEHTPQGWGNHVDKGLGCHIILVRMTETKKANDGEDGEKI